MVGRAQVDPRGMTPALRFRSKRRFCSKRRPRSKRQFRSKRRFRGKRRFRSKCRCRSKRRPRSKRQIRMSPRLTLDHVWGGEVVLSPHPRSNSSRESPAEFVVVGSDLDETSDSIQIQGSHVIANGSETSSRSPRAQSNISEDSIAEFLAVDSDFDETLIGDLLEPSSPPSELVDDSLDASQHVQSFFRECVGPLAIHRGPQHDQHKNTRSGHVR
jgi:hypothetical protein